MQRQHHCPEQSLEPQDVTAASWRVAAHTTASSSPRLHRAQWMPRVRSAMATLSCASPSTRKIAVRRRASDPSTAEPTTRAVAVRAKAAIPSRRHARELKIASADGRGGCVIRTRQESNGPRSSRLGPNASRHPTPEESHDTHVPWHVAQGPHVEDLHHCPDAQALETVVAKEVG